VIGWRSTDGGASFDSVAADYERYRPDYPPAVVARLVSDLGIAPGTVVADVGAGTGKLTRALAATGARTIAVDPGAELLEILKRQAPAADALQGTAEELPLETASVDAAVAAQAYHWFDAARAVPELHRVLRPGGRLGLVWTWWDEADPRQAPLIELLGGPRRFTDLPSAPWFELVERTTLRTTRPMTRELLVGRFTTSSAYAATPDRDRERLLARVEAIAAGFEPSFELPQQSHVFAFRRLEPA
jgi:SAM-dependent methyltransferase